MHFNEVGFAIIQTLRHEILFETPASQPGTTTGELCLLRCQSTVDTNELYLSHFPFEPCTWRHLYIAAQPLVLMLRKPRGRRLFTKTCAMLRSGVGNFCLCGYLLQAIAAFVWSIGQSLPREAEAQFKGLTASAAEVENLPISFTLPKQDNVVDLMKETARENSSLSEESLGTLVRNWAIANSTDE